MRDQLKEASRASNRTLTAEIIARLEASFRDRPVEGVGDLHRRLASLDRKHDELSDRLAEIEANYVAELPDGSIGRKEPKGLFG